MGEHVGKGACGASMQGGLFADHLAAHAGTSGSLGARARAMDYADSCCTMRASLSWEFLPTGIPQSARRTAHSESRTRGALGWTASSQPASRCGHPAPVYGQHGEQVVGQRR